MKKAIYAFSGDPITYGHFDIIKRAANCFDELIIAIGSNPDKTYMFSLKKRTAMVENMIEKSTQDLQGCKIKVTSFEGLLVDYAYEQGASVIVKGVRNTMDFNYENILHQVGESQKLGIDTFILFAKPELAHVSSSAVKAIQKEHGLLHDYVTLCVKECLEIKMAKQFIIGETGEIGVGKSTLSEAFVSTAQTLSIPCHNIDIDKIGHQILEELTAPAYQKIREDLVGKFGSEIQDHNGMIKRKLLGQKVFGNEIDLAYLNHIMLTPMIVRLKKELNEKQGLILLNGALLAEANLLHLCNNNVVLIHCEKNIQRERLRKRGLNDIQIARRIESQYSTDKKMQIINERIEKDMNGHLWLIDNSGPIKTKEISEIIEYAKGALS